MKASDIPDRLMLEAIQDTHLNYLGALRHTVADHVRARASQEFPTKVILAKFRALRKRGLVDGCDCGCRGDWRLTDKGQETLREPPNAPA